MISFSHKYHSSFENKSVRKVKYDVTDLVHGHISTDRVCSLQQHWRKPEHCLYSGTPQTHLGLLLCGADVPHLPPH